MQIEEYISKSTGRHWHAHHSLYFDCHMTSIAQILPRKLYYDFINVAAPIYLSNDWGGLAWKNGFDSEIERDVILLNKMGVDKHYVPIYGEIEKNIEQTIFSQGYCIVRVDSYYHEYFEEYFMKLHRTNGHKVTLIDFDEDFFYGIDNLGSKTHILQFRKELFIEAIYSNIYNVYEKMDTLYYLSLDKRYEELESNGVIDKMVDESIMTYLNHRMALEPILDEYYEKFASELLEGHELRAMAQIKNSYASAYMIETSYGLMYEAMQFNRQPWERHVRNSSNFISKLNQTINDWKMFKMLVKAYETSENIQKDQILLVLNRVINSEKEMNQTIEHPIVFK